jgi:hypothetical protein
MTTKVLAAIAASAALALVSFAPAYAESIPQEQIDQYGNSAAPDVDPGASKGPDAPVVEQELNQYGNDPARDFNKSKSAGPDNKTLPQMEKEGIPH